MADEAPKDPQAEEKPVEAPQGEPEPAPQEQSDEKTDEQTDGPDNADTEPETTDVAEANEANEPEEADAPTPDELEEARANEVAFSWEASEFVHHHKGPGWYAALFGAVAVLVAGAALLKYWLEIGLFLAMGGAIMVYARKPPRTLLYELTPKGITIDGKAVPFSELRSFGVLKEAEWHTIDLEPTKRFSPRLAILFDSDDFDSIVGHLELHLPRADRDPDLIERLTRLMRF